MSAEMHRREMEYPEGNFKIILGKQKDTPRPFSITDIDEELLYKNICTFFPTAAKRLSDVNIDTNSYIRLKLPPSLSQYPIFTTGYLYHPPGQKGISLILRADTIAKRLDGQFDEGPSKQYLAAKNMYITSLQYQLFRLDYMRIGRTRYFTDAGEERAIKAFIDAQWYGSLRYPVEPWLDAFTLRV